MTLITITIIIIIKTKHKNAYNLTICNTSIFTSTCIYSDTTRSSRMYVTEFILPRTHTHGLASDMQYGIGDGGQQCGIGV